jgi:hypothetical protein
MNPDERRRLLESIRQEYGTGSQTNSLNVVILPLSQNNYYVYLDNLREFAEQEKSLERIVINGFEQNPDRDLLCRNIANMVREQKENYPVEFPDARISTKDKAKYLGAIISQFVPEKAPVVGRLSKKTREWLGNGGAVIGGVAGYSASADPFSALIGALIGYAIGYCSPLIYGSTGLVIKGHSAYKERKNNKIITERNSLIKGKIDRIADRIYYQEIPFELRILETFRHDNIGQYIQNNWTAPERISRNSIDYRAFMELVAKVSSNDISYTLGRYYKTKISENNAVG